MNTVNPSAAQTRTAQPEAQTKYVVGIDLGGTKIRGGIASIDGIVHLELTEQTSKDGARALMPQVVGLVHRLAESIDIDASAIEATAIGGAGVPSSEDGQFGLAPNLGDFSDFNLVAELSRALGHRILLENDANIAALGELHDGLGRGQQSFAFVSVGTGIGVGLVLDGKIWSGARGGAGEVGYLPLGADPLDPLNHRRGALEEVVAGDAVAHRFEATAGIDRTTAIDVFDQAAKGNLHAVASIDEEARWIAYAIVAIDAVVNPGLFVLGGGIGRRAEMLVPIARWLRLLGKPSIRVRTSTLGEHAPIVGAIQLAIAALAAEAAGQAGQAEAAGANEAAAAESTEAVVPSEERARA